MGGQAGGADMGRGQAGREKHVTSSVLCCTTNIAHTDNTHYDRHRDGVGGIGGWGQGEGEGRSLAGKPILVVPRDVTMMYCLMPKSLDTFTSLMAASPSILEGAPKSNSLVSAAPMACTTCRFVYVCFCSVLDVFSVVCRISVLLFVCSCAFGGRAIHCIFTGDV